MKQVWFMIKTLSTGLWRWMKNQKPLELIKKKEINYSMKIPKIPFKDSSTLERGDLKIFLNFINLNLKNKFRKNKPPFVKKKIFPLIKLRNLSKIPCTTDKLSRLITKKIWIPIKNYFLNNLNPVQPHQANQYPSK